MVVRDSTGAWRHKAPDEMPWPEVARRFTEKTGEPLSAGAACVCHHHAMKKLRVALAGVAAEYFGDGAEVAA